MLGQDDDDFQYMVTVIRVQHISVFAAGLNEAIARALAGQYGEEDVEEHVSVEASPLYETVPEDNEVGKEE